MKEIYEDAPCKEYWIYKKMTYKQLDLLCKIQAALPRRKKNKKAFDKTHVGNTRFYI